MKVDNLMTTEASSIYYDDGFRHVLEDHLTYLREHASTVSLNLDASLVYMYEFDFFGLLAAYRIPVQLHWLVMRMNKLRCPTEAGLDINSILVPDATVVDRIRQSHMTTRKVT